MNNIYNKILISNLFKKYLQYYFRYNFYNFLNLKIFHHSNNKILYDETFNFKIKNIIIKCLLIFK